ncbi:MAG: hypothetical protein QXH34_06445 [Ignisphaera sp.]
MKEVGNTIIIDREETVGSDIAPLKREDLIKKILIKSGAKVEGSVIGGSVVEIEPEVTVEGSILASEVIFNLSSYSGENMPTFNIGGDVVGLSSIVLTPLNISSSIPSSLLTVKGNLIASDMIRVANARVYGNIISRRVELANILSNGILFLTRFEESGGSKVSSSDERSPSKLRNVVVISILVDENLGGTIEVYGDIFIMVPILNFGKTSLELKTPENEKNADYYIFLLDPSRVVDLLEPRPHIDLNDLSSEKEKSDEKDKNEKSIKENLVDHSLSRIPVREIQMVQMTKGASGLNVVSLLELEPMVQKRRKEPLKDALVKVINV